MTLITESGSVISESPPLFIGNFRSGTTLLVNLLGLHESLAAWFETKALCEPLRWLRVLQHPEDARREAGLIRLPGPAGFSVEAVAERMLLDFRDTSARIRGAAPSGKGGNESYPIGHDHALYSLDFAEQAVADWVDEIDQSADPVHIARVTGSLIQRLGKQHAELAGKQFWVNKTPEITRFGAELRACLGGIALLVMVRDGRDVVRSATRLGWAEPEEIGVWWKGMIEQSRAGGAGLGNAYMELRYEDLLADPAAHLDHVLSLMGLSASGAELVRRYQSGFSMDRALIADKGSPIPDYLDAELMRSFGYC